MKVTISTVDDKHSKTKPKTIESPNVWIVGNTVHIVKGGYRIPYAFFANGGWYLWSPEVKPSVIYTRLEIEQ